MIWTWHWWLFLVAIIPCYFFVAYTRVAMNASNIKKHGPRADYRIASQLEPAGLVGGTLVASTIFAAIVTAIAGFLF